MGFGVGSLAFCVARLNLEQQNKTICDVSESKTTEIKTGSLVLIDIALL